MADTIDIGALVNNFADKYGVPRNLANAVVTVESQGNPNALSRTGAMGVMQLMPATAHDMGVKDPWDPAQNIAGGMKYLGQLLNKYGGNPHLATAAYNAGPGNVDKYGGVPPFPETQHYVARIASFLRSQMHAVPMPQPQAAAPPQAASGIKFEPDVEPPAQASTGIKFEPDVEPPAPEPSPLMKAGTAFVQGLGLPALADVAKGAWGLVTGDPTAIERGYQTAGNISQGILGEPERVVTEAEKFHEATAQGDRRQAAYHAMGAVPLVGPQVQQIATDIERGDPAAAVGHTGALIAPMVAAPALKAVTGAAGVIPEAVTRGAWNARNVIEGTARGVANVLPDLPQTAAEGAARGVLYGNPVLGAKAAVARRLAGAVREAFQRNAPEVGEAPGPTPPAPEPTPAAPPSPPPPPPQTPGQAYAASQGIDWNTLKPADQQTFEHIARARANVASQPPPAPAVPSPAAPAPDEFTVDWQTIRGAGGAPQPTPKPAPMSPVPSPAAPPAAPATLQTPQQIAQALKAEMEQSGTAPPPEPQPSFAETARAKKVDALFDVMTRNKIPLSMVEQFGPKEWDMLAKYAGVNPPSETSIGQLKQRLADYEKAQSIPVTGATTPAEAQTEFEQARAARAARLRPPPIR